MDSMWLSLLGRDSQELEFTVQAQTFPPGMSIVAVFCPVRGCLDNIALHNMCCMSARSASRPFTCSGSMRPPRDAPMRCRGPPWHSFSYRAICAPTTSRWSHPGVVHASPRALFIERAPTSFRFSYYNWTCCSVCCSHCSWAATASRGAQSCP